MESSSSGDRWGWIMERNLIYPKRNSAKPNAYELGKVGWRAELHPPKDISTSQSWHLWMWLLWINRVIGVASHPMNGVLIRGGNTMWQQTQRENGLWRQRQKLESHSCELRTKDGWPPPEVEETRQGPSPEPSQAAWPCPHLDLGLLGSRAVGENYCVKPPSLQTLVWIVYIYYLKIGRQSPKEL